MQETNLKFFKKGIITEAYKVELSGVVHVNSPITQEAKAG
jgi:hypothetical protein